MSTSSKSSQSREPKAKREKKEKNLHDDLIALLSELSYRPKMRAGIPKFLDYKCNYRDILMLRDITSSRFSL